MMDQNIDDGCSYDNSAHGGDRVGNWMQTFLGRQFWPLDARAEEIHIEDIAHALSNNCRFAGHCEQFYSVAQHSLYVSQIVPAEQALCGLLHDATEAYLVDIPRPLKPALVGYQEIEARLWSVIATKFGLPSEMPPEVKAADNAMLLAERDQIMKPEAAPWCLPGVPACIAIERMQPHTARDAFLARFRELATRANEAAA